MTVHSASKFLNGHSDIVAGVLTGSKERIARIMESEFMTLGAIISPHDAWLMMRGLRTLKLRVEQSAATGQKIAEFLQHHPKVEQLFYPFAGENPQLELAKKQMCGCPGMMTVALKTDQMEQAEAFCDSLERFLLACSWGGYESLAFPICALYDSQNYDNVAVPWNYVRLYIGLEDPELLIADLEQALGKI